MIFIKMRRGGNVAAISRSVQSGEIQSGFKRMKALGLLKWTIERCNLLPEQFSRDDLECAKFRIGTANEEIGNKKCPKVPNGQKRPADVIGNAVHVMRIATGQIADRPSKTPARAKGWEKGRRGSCPQISQTSKRLKLPAQRPTHVGRRQKPSPFRRSATSSLKSKTNWISLVRRGSSHRRFSCPCPIALFSNHLLAALSERPLHVFMGCQPHHTPERVLDTVHRLRALRGLRDNAVLYRQSHILHAARVNSAKPTHPEGQSGKRQAALTHRPIGPPRGRLRRHGRALLQILSRDV